MKRVASVMGLPPGGVKAYERLHAAVWPAVLERLTACNVTNYSIYRYGELLFAYFEYVGTNYEADMAIIASDPATQKWWDVAMALQRPVDDRLADEWWHDLTEVFHLD